MTLALLKHRASAQWTNNGGYSMDFRARTRAVWLAVLAALLLTFGLLAGCGGSTTTSTAGSAVQVIMANRSYSPQQVNVRVGDTVTWVNQDSPQHDVVADNGEFKSNLFDKGGTFSFTFTKAGTYPYHCSIHPGMVGTVVVQ
jgi:plastocyanin